MALKSVSAGKIEFDYATAKDARHEAGEYLAQAVAIQEMASRVDLINVEDVEMLRLASCATFNLLTYAQRLFEAGAAFDLGRVGARHA